jgi:hypothetical protein
MECLPLWLTYIGQKKRTLGKTYGIEVSYYWVPMEYTENLLGIHREHDGSMLGTKEK